MAAKKSMSFHTQVIHYGQKTEDWELATLPPIFQNASHKHPTAMNLSQTFGGKTKDHVYMRLTNPTNRVLEEKLCFLEGGKGALVTSSGMAAITNACMALLRSGDEFVTGNSLFTSTYVLFSNIFRKYNLKPRFVESSDVDAIKAAITDKTRFVYLETIGNPKMDIPDLQKISRVAHDHGLPLIVDNTLATPYLLRPIELGVDIVIHSTTKYFSGHGDATGGVVIDSGKFSWQTDKFKDFELFIERKGELAYIDKVWKEHHINFGTTQAPFHAYLTMIGIDTLAIRMERILSNTQKVAEFLKTRKEVRWVNYSGLEDSPFHKIGKEQFKGKGFGGLIAFGLKDQEQCFKFIDNLKLIYNLANLGDCKSLVIHPYSTQYLSFPEGIKKDLSITADLIRLSVGIEAVEDIIADIEQALISL